MNNFRRYLDIPRDAHYRFVIGGRRYRVGERGLATIEILFDLHGQWLTARDSSWAISVREQIRQIENMDATSVLSLVVERTTSPSLRVLAIWLRGRCRGTIGTAVLERYAFHADFQTRKETTRALKRMSAWSVLKTIAATDSVERIRRLAQPPIRKSAEQRIARLTRNFPSIDFDNQKRQLFVSSLVNDSAGKPPKSPALIRAILERIGKLVGNVSNTRWRLDIFD